MLSLIHYQFWYSLIWIYTSLPWQLLTLFFPHFLSWYHPKPGRAGRYSMVCFLVSGSTEWYRVVPLGLGQHGINWCTKLELVGLGGYRLVQQTLLRIACVFSATPNQSYFEILFFSYPWNLILVRRYLLKFKNKIWFHYFLMLSVCWESNLQFLFPFFFPRICWRTKSY